MSSTTSTSAAKPNYFVDFSTLSYEEYQKVYDNSSKTDQKRLYDNKTRKVTNKEFLNVAPMSFLEELVPSLLLIFGLPGSVFSVPLLITIIGYYLGSIWKTWIASLCVLIPLAIMPVHMWDEVLSSWVSFQCLRYFSFKILYEEKIDKNKPYILVAPPHGVFPFGNILAMLSFPFVFGFSFRGLVSSAALRMPIFKQLLCSIGAVHASRSSATKTLLDNKTLGISTGGVAEVFETNTKTGDEVIVLQSRKGLVKLAIKTGASLIPCYLFGNTQLYSLWCGGENGSTLHTTLKNISRSLGFALIFFWGRFYIPLPYRIPIVGVMAKPIAINRDDNPSNEEVDRIHALLVQEMILLFDKHKETYGWKHKQLIIQ